jgi:hypothetical protein
VLAYRLGFGDMLPREQMLQHQRFVGSDLLTPWGLTFGHYAQQNWLLGDHSNAALMLRWDTPEGWGTALTQARYWRDVKKEATKHTAVIDTVTGQYGLLNYYGYALFFYHTLSAFAGATIDLPRRSMEFQPHPSAFGGVVGHPTRSASTGASAGGVAVLPILLGGDLGTLTITPTNATVQMALLKGELSFLNITVCQHVFAAASKWSPHTVRQGIPLVFQLPAPCNVGYV